MKTAALPRRAPKIISPVGAISQATFSKLAGPDASGRALVKRFLHAEKDCGFLALVTQHTYVGGNPIKHGIDLPHAIENMLSREWVTNNYPQLYRTVLEPVQKQGLPFRLTELDDHVHGVTNASDAFVSALWALDCMHWWAAHGAAGVNFQNTEWLRTDTFFRDSDGNYQMHPKAYGIKAFNLGSHGRVQSVVNKEHGAGARNARVKILSPGFEPGIAQVMFLTAGDGVQATDGVSLGGGTIVNNAPWQGKWAMVVSKREYLRVPAASAALFRFAR